MRKSDATTTDRSRSGADQMDRNMNSQEKGETSTSVDDQVHEKLDRNDSDHTLSRKEFELSRLLIRIRRGEAGYDAAEKFCHRNNASTPDTESAPRPES